MSGDVDSSRSTSGYVMTYAGGAVSWQSRLQKFVALSTTEAEYMPAVEAGKELSWMKNFLSELGMKQEKFLLHCDNQSVIHLAKNVAYNSGPSTYKEGITGCGRKWMTGSLPLWRSILTTMDPTCSRRTYQWTDSKSVDREQDWPTPPIGLKGE